MCVCLLALFLLEWYLKEGWGLPDWVRKELIDSVRPAHLTDEVTVVVGEVLDWFRVISLVWFWPRIWVSCVILSWKWLQCLVILANSDFIQEDAFIFARCTYIFSYTKSHELLSQLLLVTEEVYVCVCVCVCVCFAVSCGMWDLSYPTKDQSCIPCSGSSEF